MSMYRTPGVYKEETFPAVPTALLTGVPLFLGLVRKARLDGHQDRLSLTSLASGLWLVKPKEAQEEEPRDPNRYTVLPEFERAFGLLESEGHLVAAVRGFFENGGDLCFVQVVGLEAGVDPELAITEGLKSAESLQGFDLLCVPDLMWLAERESGLTVDGVVRAQNLLLQHCDRMGDRFVILDSLPGATIQDVLDRAPIAEPPPGPGEGKPRLRGTNGALYFPWLDVGRRYVPPCGHVAGIYARSDRRIGPHKAPANEEVEGVLDVELSVDHGQQGALNVAGVNCLRVFAGRGLRVWGARTTSTEPAWRYVSVRRLFLTAGRWIERGLSRVVFESNDLRLWARIGRELSAYFNGLFRQGALKGRTPAEAFYVKCDAETNPPEIRDLGRVVAEVGLAPAVPNEFVVVRITRGATGVTITGPARPI